MLESARQSDSIAIQHFRPTLRGPETTPGARALLRPVSLVAEVRHYALVTYVVPPSRVAAHLPPGFEPDTIDDHALVSTAVWFTHGLRWALAPYPWLSFHQAAYRTYVRYRGRPGVFSLGAELGSTAAYLLHRPMLAVSWPARFQVSCEPHSIALARELGYGRFDARIEGEQGVTAFKLEAYSELASPKDEQLARHLTHRPLVFFLTSARLVGAQRIAHRELAPWAGRLREARFDYLERLGVLFRGEMDRPLSVLVEPSVRARYYLPFPAAFLPQPHRALQAGAF